MDGHKLDGAKATINTAHELVDNGPEVLVFFDVLTRRDGNLDEHNASNPLGVLGEEDFESVEFLRDTLDIVEAIDTNDELDTFELAAQGGDPLLDGRLVEALNKLIRINANGERAHSDKSAVPVDAVGCRRGAEDAGAAAEEVAGVVVGVKADQIAVEEAGEESLTDGEDTIDLGGGEGCVEEEADADVLAGVCDLGAEHLGEQHEVVIVDPDEVTVLDIVDDGLREEAVHFLVGCPSGLVEGDLAWVVVEERPQNGVCTCLVVSDGEHIEDQKGTAY